MPPDDKEVARFIRDALEQNYELLCLESGHALSAHVKATALQQALFYWYKLKDIATRVTETEVRLNLPNLTSPEAHRFGIEGVVDIVQDDERTVMYDIKTHEADQVRENIGDYERQLNVYAHIWCTLRGQHLDSSAIIATAYPDSLKEAWKVNDQKRMAYELQKWEPLVEIGFDPAHVEEVIADFGRIVDCIESGEFAPASPEKLKTRSGHERREFASHVCRYCDARFSCDSYRSYALESHGRPELALRQYLEDFGTDLDQQDWLSNNLDAASPTEDLG
jgi:hypothetical protein